MEHQAHPCADEAKQLQEPQSNVSALGTQHWCVMVLITDSFLSCFPGQGIHCDALPASKVWGVLALLLPCSPFLPGCRSI